MSSLSLTVAEVTKHKTGILLILEVDANDSRKEID